MKEFIVNKNGFEVIIILEPTEDGVQVIVRLSNKKTQGYLEKDYIRNIAYIKVGGEVAEEIKKIAKLKTTSEYVKISIPEDLYKEIIKTREEMLKEMEERKRNLLKEQLKSGITLLYKQEIGFNATPIREWFPVGSLKLELEKYGLVSRQELKDFLFFSIQKGWVKEIKEGELTNYEVLLTEERLNMMRNELYSQEKEKERKRKVEFYRKLLDNELELLKYIFTRKIYVNEDMHFADFNIDPADSYEWHIIKEEFEKDVRDIAKSTVIYDSDNNPHIFYLADENVLGKLKKKYKDLVQNKRMEIEKLKEVER